MGKEIHQWVESRVRRGWERGPGHGTVALAVLYGLASDARNAIWNLGLASSSGVPVPVISIGGLTVGGSGKTPIAGAIAAHLAAAGCRVAVITAGYRDEMSVLAALQPSVDVSGGRDRTSLAVEAIRAGASVIVLDSGFQHRRLRRDLEVLTLAVEEPAPRRRLPAGSYRERWAALRRADAAVVLRRTASSRAGRDLARSVRLASPGTLVVQATLSPVRMEPLNAAARRIDEPRPGVAVAGTMWPQTFFASLDRLGLEPEHRIALSDHAGFDARTLGRLEHAAGPSGLVCTAKDSSKLGPLLSEGIPAWQVIEEVAWDPGSHGFLAGLVRLARA